MATQTYAQLRKQIAALEAQAAKAKNEETAGVVARIREAIASYGLTPEDLFGGKSGVVNTKTKTKAKAKAKTVAKSKASVAPKYIDGKGGQWVGLGKRPKWMSEALAAGNKLEDFLAEKFKSAVEAISLPPAAVVAQTERPVVKKTSRKMAKQAMNGKPAAVGKKATGSARASYADGMGNSWGGMGPMPKWLREAVAGGKSKEDFLVKP